MKTKVISFLLLCTLLFVGCSTGVAVDTATPTATIQIIIGENTDGVQSTVEPTASPQPTAFNGPYKPIAVMIENSSASRPQDGLAEADYVYEATVEGGITRFLAIYNSDLATYAGPVRSCRVAFAELLCEWDSMLIHAGGPDSAEAFGVYKRFRELGIKQRRDIVKSNIGEVYDSDRSSPHNKYINVSKQTQYYNYTPVARNTLYSAAVPQGAAATQIQIKYSSSNNVKYEYDAATGVYKRYISGTQTVNRKNGLIVAPDNVIVQYCKEYEYANSDAGHLYVGVIGSGNAVVFRDGKYIECTWKKSSGSDKTQYIDSTGNEIMLKPGKTWVQIVGSPNKVSYN